MKKKVFQMVLLFALSAIWLFPFQKQSLEWILLVGAYCSFLCLYLIPRKIAAFSAAAAVLCGFSLYSGVFFAVFSPGIAACSVFFAAVRAKKGVPVKKDGFFIVTLAAAALCTLGSILYVLSAFKNGGTGTRAFDRHMLFSALAAAAAALLFALSLRKDQTAAGRKKEKPAASAGFAIAFAAMLVSFGATGLSALRTVYDAAWCLTPVFLCAFAVLTVPSPATEALAGRAGQ